MHRNTWNGEKEAQSLASSTRLSPIKVELLQKSGRTCWQRPGSAVQSNSVLNVMYTANIAPVFKT